MSPKVGDDIESICGKCGDTWHVVVAKVGDKIAKVVCKMCSGQHRYRPPADSVVAQAATRRRSTKSTTKSTTSRSRKKAVPTAVEPDLSRPPRPYNITESFGVGDRLVHPKFGTGVVQSVVGRGKIEVFFPDAPRVMAHERS